MKIVKKADRYEVVPQTHTEQGHLDWLISAFRGEHLTNQEHLELPGQQTACLAGSQEMCHSDPVEA